MLNTRIAAVAPGSNACLVFLSSSIDTLPLENNSSSFVVTVSISLYSPFSTTTPFDGP